MQGCRALRTTLSTLAVMAGMSGGAAAQELTVWTLTGAVEAENAAWAQIIEEFEAANPGVTIRIEQRSVDEHKAALRVAARSDQGPDIYFMWAGLGLGGEFVQAGLSAPLDAYYEQYGWEDRLLPSAMGFTTAFTEERHGVPYSFAGEAVYYNKALFEQAGITAEPQTYEELKAAADALKAAGIPAFTFGGTVNWHLMRLMDVILETKCGAETHDALKAMTADWTTTPCAVESFAELADWSANHILSPFMGIDQAQSFNLFLANRAAMMLEGDWLVGQISQAAPIEGFDLFIFPTGTGRLYGFAEYLYISSRSEHPDLAAKFLDYLLSDEVQQRHLGAFGAISVNRNVEYQDVGDAEQQWLDIFADHSEIFVNGDQAFPLDVTTEYFRVINEVAQGNMTPEEGAAAMQSFIVNRG
ncbi:carbohydrate ABC transporter substrate-binding protein, CUT1 family [Rubellimicrobium thermophilum DSM 16684]|uniref:Carbohydrate ABC transporter substrate-binding protein, CUT1 family n=2 Tax=Rubellimicrobium TaxID=295418 RepID=S9R662_9RHOB|nr:carbohydrate ABC transporter substrate-binding protein, CUT1 family [Rubellimicrobium thermophilum DSM 16684]